MNKKKPSKGLGRGLGAIFTDLQEPDAPPQDTVYVQEIPLDKIAPNPRQPRKGFDPGKIKELAETIATHGVIQPVVVQKSGDGYLLIAGERRVRASTMAGLTHIPALVKDYSSAEIMEITLVENLQREDLNPIEEALAYQQLIDEFGLTQEKLAGRLGKSRSAITNALRLLALDDEMKQYVLEGRLTAGQIRPLLTLDSKDEQKALARSAVKHHWSTRKIEAVAQKIKAGHAIEEGAAEDDRAAGNGGYNPAEQLVLQDILERMRRYYGTKVSIKRGKREGKIELSFFGDEDLERLVQLMLHEDV